MIQLNFLGGVSIVNGDGTRPEGAALQRRVLALLAITASADNRGITRDRVTAILWPDADAERGRHALSQILYHTRTALREPALFMPGKELRLNAEVVTSDVAALQDALSRRHDEDVANAYHGTFLEGFSLPGSPEFDEWMSGMQRHYATRAAEALERLGAAADARGDNVGAVSWRQRLFANDIASSRAALKLMESFVKAGDSVAALRIADLHRRAVRSLLEAEPDAAITSLENRIRSAPPVAPTVAPRVLDRVSISQDSLPSVSESAQVDAPVVRAPDSARSRETPLWRRLTPLAAAAAVALMVWSGIGGLRTRTTGADYFAITPFRVVGGDASIASLGDGIVDLLSSRFQDTALVRADAGAAAMVRGTIVSAGRRVHIGASLANAPGGNRDGEIASEGSVDSLPQILDELAARLLASWYGESDRMWGAFPVSLQAVREYFAGQKAYRRGQYQMAARAYERALRADSGFALAALQLALVDDRIDDGERSPDAVSIAWRGRDRLAPRDRRQLLGVAGPQYPLPSTVTDATSALTSTVNLRPLRSDMWFEFGDRLLRQGPRLVLDDPIRRALGAFERSLELDPSDRAGARPLLVVAAARLGDTATMLQYASPVALHDSMQTLAPFVEWTVARVRGDMKTLARMREQLPALDAENLRLIAMSSLYEDFLRQDGERAAELLDERSSGRRGLDALLAQHAFALARGDTAGVLRVTERIKSRAPGMHAHHRLRILDALYGGGNVAQARASAARLSLSMRPFDVPMSDRERAIYLADACVLEQWRMHEGDYSHTLATIAMLQRSPRTLVPIPIGASPHACAPMLQTSYAVATGAPDAHARLWALDSLLLSGAAAGDAARYAHIFVARLHLHFNDRAAALSALRRRSYLAGWPRYGQTARATESRLLRGDAP